MRLRGSHKLKTLGGEQTRPTLARVREAVMNIWRDRLYGCQWLDLCAGFGTMGAAALDQGAARVVGIEHHARACGVIAENWQKLAQEGQGFEVLRGEVVTLLPRLAGQRFDLIYFDPPYGAGLYLPVLRAIAQYQLLAPEGEIAVEYDPKQWQPQAVGDLAIGKQKRYGNSYLQFYTWATESSKHH